MRYFFLAYLIIGLMFVGMLGRRGERTHRAPLEVFPDMDRQDKVQAQEHEGFFRDGQADRLPVPGTAPLGYSTPAVLVDEHHLRDPEFSPGRTSYYATGMIGDYFGKGMPAELSLTEENVGALLRRGSERFSIFCAPCHGASGDGMGMASQFGLPGVANFHLETFSPNVYPDGRIFNVITHGKGLMGPYGYNIPVSDRWAIIAYIRALQVARQAPYEEVRDLFIPPFIK